MHLHYKFRLFLLILLISCFILSYNKTIFAQNLLYQENFDSYSNGSFPLGWNSDAINPSSWQISENKLVGYTPSNGIYTHIIFNSNWNNYILNFQIKGISGVDRFVVFRVDHNRGFGKEEYYFKYTEADYGFQSYIELGKGSSGPIQGCFPQNSFYSQNGQTHNFQISLNNSNIKIFELVNNDKTLLFDCEDHNALLYGGIGFFNQPNGIGLTIPNIYEVDNITINSQTNDTLLNVPNIKQYDPIWNNDIYDHANIWSPYKSSIGRWGCSLTVSSMILQYYDHNISPKELNQWLVTQKDGYLKNGLLNWIAISRYSKISNLLNNNLPILEFQVLNNDPSLLKNEILAQPKGRPAILKIPNHFLVVKGISQNDYYINDPGSEKNLLSEITDNYISLIKFTPSTTDLSYIMLTYDYDLAISIKDPNNNLISNDRYYIEKPPYDIIENKYSLNENIGIFLLPKPVLGNYELKISKKGMYTIEGYLYDENGNLSKREIKGILNNNFETITLNYGNTNNLKRNINIDLIINKVKSAFDQKLIYKKQIYKQIFNQLQLVKFFIEKNKISSAKNLLRSTTIHLAIYKKHFISKDISTIITQDIVTLINTL